ncbi:lipocalin family protein [Pedobacter cryoconitis]|uniref:Apolipoprotein D and lipocalin family protein n=1 Tax=Pedobacter cryoconitis TaxID=188932 RepID=A0A7X0J460_9SPHI|nr:lipocalin family protein [Pedobacter cryoconitis]MBB6500528.1 apolipoprotein D and lipocalin family protein [Pedobacter cryoconitis]
MLDNTPVEKVDIMSYAGKWYSLLSIPTFMDKNWHETTETYVIHPDGYYAVFTTYKVAGETETKYVRSKLIVVRGTNNAQLKAQFVWPLKIDYWIVELAEDYSYAVIGHPKHKHLSILSRKPELPASLLDEIIDRCQQRGYDISKLVSQEHKAAVPKGHSYSS